MALSVSTALTQMHCQTDGQYCAAPPYQGAVLYSCVGADIQNGTLFDCVNYVYKQTGSVAPAVRLIQTQLAHRS